MRGQIVINYDTLPGWYDGVAIETDARAVNGVLPRANAMRLARAIRKLIRSELAAVKVADEERGGLVSKRHF